MRKLGFTVAALAVTLVLAPAAGATSLGWSQPFLISHQPPWVGPGGYPIDTGQATRMTCPTAGLCVLIDSEGNVVTSTDPTGGSAKWTATAIDNNSLTDVACASGSLCVAVGAHGDLLTSTNPTGGSAAWSYTQLQTAFGEQMNAVACAPGTSLCVAAGGFGESYLSSNPTGGDTAWKEVPSSDFIQSISCPSSSLCVASGIDNADETDDILTINPSSSNPRWTITPNVGGITGQIACASASLCMVPIASNNFNHGGGLLISTDPTGGLSAWTRTTLPGERAPDFPNGYDSISTVTCVSASLCLAVDSMGYVSSSTNPTGGDTAWTATSGGPVLPSANAYGVAIACGSSTMCVALAGGGPIATSTNPTGDASTWTTSVADETNVLNDVSCASSSLCAAVDDHGNVLVASSNPGAGSGSWKATNLLNDQLLGPLPVDDVSCTSSGLCVATKIRSPVGSPNSFLYVWTSTDSGNTWSSATSAGQAPFGAEGVVGGLSCVAGGFCAAIDSSGDVYVRSAADGSWSAPASHGLTSISCPSSSFCAGTTTSGGIAYSTNGGSSWQSYGLGTGLSEHVSCASSALCVASDSSSVYTTTNPTGGTAAWTQISDTAIEPGSFNGFSSVSCSSGGLCALADNSGDIATSATPTAGAGAWSLDSGVSVNGLEGVACGGSTLCIAIDNRGDAYAGTPYQTPTAPTISPARRPPRSPLGTR